MASMIDYGIVLGTYHDYDDDTVARQRELETMEDIKGGDAEPYHDPFFPADGRSLYFDEFNPPKGALPNDNIKWCSIAAGEVPDCTDPVVFADDPVSSSSVTGGALGNEYFVNALRLLSCRTDLLRRLLVSDTYSSRGMYTWKFFKAGKWRYVHIDDRIPCRMSGRVNFCRNGNPNEVFAMLIEKAYAKLHGCYEALAYGMIDLVIQDLTHAAPVQLVRSDRLSLDNIVDTYWRVIEKSLEDRRLVGCGRWISDPYGEHTADRKGVSLGYMYQIVDIRKVSSDASALLDKLSVGMVCVRNFRKEVGRFTGRWTYGSQLWVDYVQIGEKLELRTKELQFQRGLGPDPTPAPKTPATPGLRASSGVAASAGEAASAGVAEAAEERAPESIIADGDEPDGVDFAYVQSQKPATPQPQALDLQWIQIEDFVEVFNRIYILNDLMLANPDKKQESRRYVSRWVPGERLFGFGGPPLVIPPDKSPPVGAAEAPAAAETPADVGAPADVAAPAAADATATVDSAVTLTAALNAAPVAARYQSKEPFNDELALRRLLEDDSTKVVSGSFTRNPMYPFSVVEPTDVCVSLYQEDRRWSVGRLGDDPRDITCSTFSSRGFRLAACMKYKVAIGFAVVKLSGSKKRVTDFQLKKIAGGSYWAQFANVSTACVRVTPGRYAIVPFTHTALPQSMDYVLQMSFNEGAVELELADIIAEHPEDLIDSDEEGDPEDEIDFDALGVDDEEEMERIIAALRRERLKRLVLPPKFIVHNSWEYTEDSEELSVVGMYDEIGDLAKYVDTLRGEVRRIDRIIRDVGEQGFVIRKSYEDILNDIQAKRPKKTKKGSPSKKK